MSQNQNIGVVQQAYGNFQTGNIDGLVAQMEPGISWQIPTIPAARISGQRQGRDAVLDFFRMLGEDQEVLQFEPREFVGGDGDTVVAMGQYQWRVRSTGKEWGGPFAHVFTVRDGRIAGFREFMDTAAATEAYRA